jgi:hypothetical protein
MKPSARRIERLLAKVEAELACSARPRRYCFYFDEEAEAKAQGLPYMLVPRELSREEFEKKYCQCCARVADIRPPYWPTLCPRQRRYRRPEASACKN